jgi:osmotically inducible lipoprotein OsmB
MSKPNLKTVVVVGLSALSLVGCENLPGSKGTQGAVIGGTGGAAVGAAVASHNRLLGALVGGAVGAAGGYIVGANSDRILGHDHHSASEAGRQSQEHPATAQDALRSTTADLNNDGFVTLDEVVAMHDAGLTDTQMLDRMRATSQVFELTPEQRQYLLDRGVSRFVIDQMETLNKATRDRLMTLPPATTTPVPGAPPVIGQPPTSTYPPPVTYPPVSTYPPAS